MEEKYGIIKGGEKKSSPVGELLRVPHNGEDLIIGYPVFGRNKFSNNISEMQKIYYNSELGVEIYFTPTTTAESISAISFDFENLTKKDFFDSMSSSYIFQMGQIIKTSEGVFTNPPKDKEGNIIIDENILKNHLNDAEKINGVYIVSNKLSEGVKDFGFAPYESFERGIQSVENFAVNPKTNGLARILEHTTNKVAKKIKNISDNYPEVYVFRFLPMLEPVVSMSGLGSWSDKLRLGVDDNYWNQDREGYAFGKVIID